MCVCVCVAIRADRGVGTCGLVGLGVGGVGGGGGGVGGGGLFRADCLEPYHLKRDKNTTEEGGGGC